MNVSDIVSLISSLGFPIVCSIGLFWFINKTLKDVTSSLQSQYQKLDETIERNTDATTKLVTTVEILTKIGSERNNG